MRVSRSTMFPDPCVAARFLRIPWNSSLAAATRLETHSPSLRQARNGCSEVKRPQAFPLRERASRRGPAPRNALL
jgi:hypothetical protein